MRQSATERMFRVGTIYYTNKSNNKKKKKKTCLQKLRSLTHNITTSPLWVPKLQPTRQLVKLLILNAIYSFQTPFLWQKQHSFGCFVWASIELRASPLPLIIPSSSSELLPEQPTITTTTTTAALLLTLLQHRNLHNRVGKEKERERER